MAGAVGALAYGGSRLVLGGDPDPFTATPVFDVRRFGAVGDGTTNDTGAFQRASAAVRGAGGGKLVIPAGTYIVGRQRLTGTRTAEAAYRGEDVIRIDGCARPVVIDAHGAILRTTPGLRFGAFDPVSGQPFYPARLPFSSPAFRADIYEGAVHLNDNRRVIIRGLEADGHLASVVFGGQYGDGGYQARHDGIVAMGNDELFIIDCHLHHHGRDGLVIGYPGLSSTRSTGLVTLVNVVADFNGRQGLSWTGGVGLRASRCAFNFTGTQTIPLSNPGAGLDIEPENSICRDGTFTRCDFIGNRGFGVVAASGDSADIRFRNCVIWGAAALRPGETPHAIWPNRPGMRFEGCKIYGSVVNVFGRSSGPATSFNRCLFEDRAHPEYGVPYVGGVALVQAQGAGISFLNSRITASTSRSIVLGSPDPTALASLADCVVMHRHRELPASSYQAALSHVMISNTRFEEQELTRPYYIAAEGVKVAGDIRVDGPHTAWQHVGGPTGLISRS